MRLHVHEWGDRDAPPLVALHGVTAHGRRFQRLAEKRLASRFRVLAPDLRGHGRSDWEPPWTIATHVADILETLDAFGISRPDWLGHSFGGRLILELASRAPARLGRVVLLDPAIQVLPHVAFDFAELERGDRVFTSPEEAVEVWAASAPTTPRAALAADVAEHLEERGGGLRYRYCQSCVVSLYGELAAEPPPPETLRAETLLLYSPAFGLVREGQISDYRAALGDRLAVAAIPGGHVLYWDAFDETADAIDEFLR
jgi:lipase